MIVFFLAGAVLLLAIAVAAAGAGSAPRRPPPALPPAPEESSLSPTELSLVDPIEALRLFGTPQDAARLGEQGVDLGALGYHSPDG